MRDYTLAIERFALFIRIFATRFTHNKLHNSRNRFEKGFAETPRFRRDPDFFARHCISAHWKGFDVGVELTKFFSGRNEQIVLYCSTEMGS